MIGAATPLPAPPPSGHSPRRAVAGATHRAGGFNVHFGDKQLKRCKYGWMLFHGPYIGKCFELYGQYSEDEVRVFRAFAKPGDTVIDVGANIGDLTLPLAGCVGDLGRVYAFESQIDVFNVLCANLALNQVKNVKPINAFVATSGAVDTASANWGQYGYVSPVWPPPFVAIDQFDIETCSFIKVDVDGNELNVIQSAAATIARTRPILYLENDVREKSAALLDHLLNDEYIVYWHPAPIFEPDNFFGNPANHWAPRNIISMMMLCVPKERDSALTVGLRKVTRKDDWWS